MMWMLILRYQINKRVKDNLKGGDVGKRSVLKWVNKAVSSRGLTVKNFTKDFKNPKVISILVNRLVSGMIDIEGLVGNNDDQVLICCLS